MIIRLRQRQRRARSPNGPDSGPRIPAERDESHDSQAGTPPTDIPHNPRGGAPRTGMQQAHDDAVSGQVDTDMYKNGVGLNPLDSGSTARADTVPPMKPAPGVNPKKKTESR